ncbi:hypothetical protein [Peribacillus sp. SCS-155]|uniref:hypothetical protein n=1 Tax=Peribacillus sedimenti TaxID=3115297 RepID=UPI003906C27F
MKMIVIRVKEEVLVIVIKLIKKHFSRLVRSYYNEEEYQTCKNNIDSMYKKIKDVINNKFDWSTDLTLFSKANELLDDLKNVKCIYESFIKYNKTPNNLDKYKVEVTLSIYLAKKLEKFLEIEIAFQMLFNKKSYKELNHVLSFQKELKNSIESFTDDTILVAIKADEYKSWELLLEEYNSNKANQEHSNKINEDENSKFESHFSDESDLHKLGYKITGLSRYQRWDILKNKAIPQLGLDRTVLIITGLIETRKLQQDGEIKYANAINEWNYDLSRLADYY